ncbi:MAG TPA: calcium-binding protein [Xanthobacteraceae bacterium]|jgi:hypothetical protein|nr:calcium-binding protein [Xanthobacteraceae bacterium]
MPTFTSFAGLLQQSFASLGESAAAELATLVSNTNVPGSNQTYGELFADTMGESASSAGSNGIVLWSNQIDVGSTSLPTSAGEYAAVYAQATGKMTIAQTELGGAITQLANDGAFDTAGSAVSSYLAENGISLSSSQAAASVQNAFWRGGSEQFVSQASGSVDYIGVNSSDTSAFVQNEIPQLQSNSDITDVNGVPRSELDTLSAGDIASQANQTGSEFFDPSGEGAKSSFGWDAATNSPTWNDPSTPSITDVINSTPNVPENIIDAANDIGDPGIVSFDEPNVSTFTETVEGIGGIAGAIGTGIVVADIINTTVGAIDQVNLGDDAGAAYSMATLAGRVEGGLYGAEALGEVGAELGSLIGPEGTAAGGLLGGIVGGVLGYTGGQGTVAGILGALGNALNGLGGSGTVGIPSWLHLHPAAPNPRDPLVLSLTGGAIQLTSVTNSTTYFDYSGSGFAVQTGWVTPNEGILVEETNSSGPPAYQMLGADSGDGFADLTSLDANSDGVLNASDSAFSNLYVWIDTNSNGQMDSGELHSLSSLGINSIGLSTTPSVQTVNGNEIVSTGTFTITSSYGTAVDPIDEVNFATNSAETRYTPPTYFSYSTQALMLPQLAGYGLAPDLWVAMSDDPTLLEDAQNLVADASSMSASEFDAAFQNLVFEWVGASDIDPTSQGTYVNAQHLAVDYAFYGIDPATDPVYQIAPNWHTGPMWEDIYSSIIQALEVRFASQMLVSQLLNDVDATTALTDWWAPFANIVFDKSSDTISVDLNELLSSIVQNAPTDATAAQAYYASSFQILGDLRVDLFNGNIGSLVAAVLPQLSALGVGSDVEASALSAFGFATVVDEGSTTGSITDAPSNGALLLGSGDKAVSGGTNDLYVYDSSGGNDTIIDNGSTAALVMDGIASTDVVLERPNAGNDLLIVDEALGTTITLTGEFSNNTIYYVLPVPFATIAFSDGVTLTPASVTTELYSEASRYLITAQSGGDTLTAQETELNLFGFNVVVDPGTGDVQANFGEADVLFLGTGADTIAHGVGDDIYVYTAAGGNDTIADSDVLSQVVFSDIGASDVSISRDIADLNDFFITINTIGKTLTVDGQFTPWSTGPLAVFTFADGTVWTADQVEQMLLDQESAYTGPILQYGYGGYVLGYGNRNDTLMSGAGDKVLDGEGGNDTYIYASTSGDDIITDPGDTSQLQFSDLDPSDISLSRTGGSYDLDITINTTGNTLTIDGQFTPWGVGPLQSFTFANGTVWTAAQIQQMLLDQESAANGGSIYGYGGNDTLIAGLGDKYMNGEGGSDTYVYSSTGGNDIVNDPGSSSQLILTDIDASDVGLSRDEGSYDLVLTVGSTGKTITIDGQFTPWGVGPLQTISFADGTVWTASDIQQSILDQESAADGGSIYGFGGNDTLVAGLGDKFMDGEGGFDTYVYSSAGGNDVIADPGSSSQLVFSDINSTDVSLSRNPGSDDLVITVNSTGKTVTVVGQFNGAGIGPLQGISFADDIVWTASEIAGTVSGTGNYALSPGTGQVTVAASSITGTIFIPAGITPSQVILQADNSGDLTIELPNLTDSVTLTGDLNHDWWGVSSAVGSISTNGGSSMTLGQPSNGEGQPFTFTWIGTASDTTLTGSDYGSNVFELGAGGDTVTFGNTDDGGSGNNTVAFDKGDGHATITLNSGAGVINMAADIAANDIIFQADSSGDLTIGLKDAAADSVTIDADLHTNWFGVSSAVSQIIFSDASTMTIGEPSYGQGQPISFTWIGSSADTTLVGSDFGSNVFYLGAGGDAVTFGNTDAGGTGNNTVFFDKGDGDAVVTLNGGVGIVQMAADISAADVVLQADNSGDLTIALMDDSADSITLDGDLHVNWYGVSSAVSQIDFSDGSSVTVGEPSYGQGQPLSFTWLGSSSDTALVGSDYGSNTFYLGAGGDAVTFGNTNDDGSGNNTVVFDKGDGQASVTLNSGVGTIKMASDITDGDAYLQADSTGDLIIKLRDSSDSLSVAGDLSQNWWGISSQITQLSYADGSTLAISQPGYNTNPPPTFTWIGSGSSETLTGSAFGNNVFEDGGGNDTLDGGGGYDTYKFGSTFGQTTINNYASDHDGSAYGEIDFASGVNSNQLWFQQSGNNLQIDLLGTNDSVTVSNWYASDARNQVESINAGDGLKVDSQLQQLVGAMATYTSNNPGFDPTQASQMPTDSTLQNALAAAWHH